MTRRGATLIVGTVLTVALGVLAMFLPVPYAALGPGPAINTLGTSPENGNVVVQITGRTTYPAEGSLDFTTVLFQPDMTLGTALAEWFDGEVAVVPREVVIPPGQTREESDEQSERDMRDSQDFAKTAALRHLRIPVTTTAVVDQVVPGSPAAKELKAKDLLLAIDGKPVRTATEVGAAIRTRPAGRTVRITYRRGGVTKTATLGTIPSPDADRHATIGIGVVTESSYPFSITFDPGSVKGPSAGLMFALGIVDKLTPGSLTGGRHVAGTGTIDAEGNVGPIGGIYQKLIGAKATGASVFLVPDGNWEEAGRANVDGLQLVRVPTLEAAVSALEVLAQKQ